MRKSVPILCGLAAVPVIAAAQIQPVPPENIASNDAWANAAEVSNQLDAPSFDPAADEALPPAKEIDRPEFNHRR